MIMLEINDDMDVACYSLRWDGDDPIVSAVSAAELEALPEWITDSINLGIPVGFDGLMYGSSEESLLCEPLWS